jgi:hypothetical protein
MAVQLGDSWFEKEQLLAEAAKKDKQRMEELNKVLTNVSRIRSFPCEHVSHDIANLASTPYDARQGCFRQSYRRRVLSG